MRSLLISASALAFASPAHADITVATAIGDVTLDGVPETIIAMDAAALDTLGALGVTPSAITVPTYLPHLAGTLDDVATVGSAFEPDFEGIANLGADAILIGARGMRFMENLAPLAPTLNMGVPFGDDLVDATVANLAAYGVMTGMEDAAAALGADIVAAAEGAVAAAADEGTALVIIVSGEEIAAYGAGSRFGWMHTDLGLAEAVEGLEAGRHGQAISQEFIADANPDVLLVIDRGSAIGQGDGAKTVLDTDLVNGTSAAQNGKIVYLPAAEVYIGIGGYTSTKTVLDAVASALAN